MNKKKGKGIEGIERSENERKSKGSQERGKKNR